MSGLSTSVLVPSYRRPHFLVRCLESLATQTHPPDEVLVVWQGDDSATRDTTHEFAERHPLPLRAIHAPEPGVVPAENAALDAALGEVLLLIDDDAAAPPTWIERHLSHYGEPSTGAVGGPAVNFHADGRPFPTWAPRRLGELTWYGRAIGNMHDLPPEWRDREPVPVDHLVGYNLSVRRQAFGRFESSLKAYWQGFELDTCLQVRGNGYLVWFDFANVVEHRPSNPTYAPGRSGDLRVKVYNAAYNRAFVLAKHSPGHLRIVRLAFLLGIGSAATPGFAGFAVGLSRYRNIGRELTVLGHTWSHHLRGWRDGTRARRVGTRASEASA